MAAIDPRHIWTCVTRLMNTFGSSSRTVFYAKSWFLYVLAIMFTILAVFCATLGPLFLFDILKRADGNPGTDAGIAMSIIAVPMCLVASLGWFNVYARRRPLLRICKEGLEVNVLGASSLDGIPLVPSLIRVVWLVISLQGFKTQIGWIPWESLRNVQVCGLPMMRSLTIDATIAYPHFRGDNITAQIGNGVAFRDADFQVPLETIASAILTFSSNLDAQLTLPSLHD